MPVNFVQDTHQGHAILTFAQCNDWIMRTHANLIAAGCIQTTDTGQYTEDLSTVLVAANANIGYRIYELNDAYSGTVPVYIRFDFIAAQIGSSAYGHRAPRLNITVGFGTNGAGQITGGAVEKNLKTYITSSSASAAPIYNINGKTFTSKGDDFFIHGNEIVSGLQSQYSIIEGGFFAVIRSKYNGVVDPNAITFIYGDGSPAWAVATSLNYTRITKNIGVSQENTHMFRVPRVRTSRGLMIATIADISESGVGETTDRLIAMRTSNADSPWSTHTLSLDGVTEKTYLQLPHPPSTTFSNISLDKLTVTFIPDMAEKLVGSIGILIDE